jgi:hypothetical protein
MYLVKAVDSSAYATLRHWTQFGMTAIMRSPHVEQRGLMCQRECCYCCVQLIKI